MNETPKEKKKWYKSKWIWIVAIVMLFYSIMNACQNNSAFNEELTAIQDHISQNQFSEAETKLKAIKSSHSDNPSVYVTYADFYVVQNNYLSALNILDEGHNAVYVTGDYDATAEKREVIDNKIKEVACKYAETYESTGDYITAIDILFQRKLEDEVKEKFYKYADYYENQKDYQKAIELYQKAVNDYSSFFSGIFKKKDLRAKIEALTEQMRKAEPEEPKTTEATISNVIIGSDAATVRKLLNSYTEKSSVMGENAIDFDNDNLLITVFFTNGKADGVIFLSNNLNTMNTITGEGSYVSQHYDELVKMATNDTGIKIESDLMKYNSKGNKKVASELYIGNTPYADENSSSASQISETSQSTTKSTEAKEESEFSYCLESGIVAGVKIYLQPNNESYVGTITAFSDEIYNEKGKKEKGVYLSGGASEGWYKRKEIRYCYVRKDDPKLPSGRLFD